MRIKSSKTQQAIANMLNITQATYSGWETGKFEIDAQNLIKLANIFETTTDYILGRESANANIINTPEEGELLELFRELTEKYKKGMLKAANDIKKQMVFDELNSMVKAVADTGESGTGRFTKEMIEELDKRFGDIGTNKKSKKK